MSQTLVTLALVVAGLFGFIPESYPVQPPDLQAATVTNVVDGDTLDVQLAGKTERLRLIGIDTPETKDPRKPVQCFGQEASERAAAILGGKQIQLEADPSQATRDQYNRLLVYAWVAGRLYNLDMIADGYAHEYTYDAAYKYQAEFKQAEQEARSASRGLWSPGTCNGDTEQPAKPVQPGQGQRCFPETSQCISGVIRAYWEGNGGLAVFGYPITTLASETNADGFTGPTQWFERDRLEDHSAEGKGVLAGRLGAQKLAMEGRPWQGLPQASRAPTGCRFFFETAHSLCPPFLAYWEQNGGLARFGFPVSEPGTETNAAGFTGTVQWFERRRMEAHPENQPPYDVLLGLLGTELHGNNAPPPPPPADPILPPPTYNNCQADPNPGAAPNAPVRIVGLDKVAEVVTLRNVSAAAVNLDGWHLCSINGNQHIPVSGTLAPGESRGLPSGGLFWNNSERDDAALYNPNGQLVSYFVDR